MSMRLFLAIESSGTLDGDKCHLLNALISNSIKAEAEILDTSKDLAIIGLCSTPGAYIYAR